MLKYCTDHIQSVCQHCTVLASESKHIPLEAIVVVPSEESTAYFCVLLANYVHFNIFILKIQVLLMLDIFMTRGEQVFSA